MHKTRKRPSRPSDHPASAISPPTKTSRAVSSEATLASQQRQPRIWREFKLICPASVQALTELYANLDKRRSSLEYCAAKAMGYLIGSGPVESAANHVVQQRMKRSGMRWEAPGASAMLALRAVWRTTGGFAKLAAAA